MNDKTVIKTCMITVTFFAVVLYSLVVIFPHVSNVIFFYK